MGREIENSDKKQPLKILVINWQDWLNPMGGGAEVHLHEVFKRIAACGHEVSLYCSRQKGAARREVLDGIKIYRFGGRNDFNLWVPFYYLNHFAFRDYDVVVDDVNKIPFFTPLYVRKPLLGLSHHFFGDSIFRQAGKIAGSYVFYSENMMNKIYKNTPFTVVSKSTLDEFGERGFDTSKFSMVPNAINHEEFPLKICEKYPEPSCAYFGRLKKYKSVDHLFFAFAKVLKELPNAKLHIIGRGDFRPELEETAAKLNITQSVIFHGFVTDAEKAEILSRVKCVVNTSMKEGWGITNIEANACGTPVLSADSPGLRDSVKDGVSGLLYEYGSIDELAEKLYKILSDNELNQKLSSGAIEWAKSFSWDKSAENMINACRSVISEKSKK